MQVHVVPIPREWRVGRSAGQGPDAGSCRSDVGLRIESARAIPNSLHTYRTTHVRIVKPITQLSLCVYIHL